MASKKLFKIIDFSLLKVFYLRRAKKTHSSFYCCPYDEKVKK